MIDTPDNCISNCFLCNTMEQCSRQCIRRTFYAVLVGVSPIVLCLLFIGLARLILYRLEMVYYRRQKITDRRPSIFSCHSGRLALSYTPVSNAEIQRIIQGEYKSQRTRESCAFVYNNPTNTRKAPRFIRSILPRRESALPTSSILSNLVIRRSILDANPIMTLLPPVDVPLQPTFSIINEQNKQRASTGTITKDSIESTTTTTTKSIAAMNHNNNHNNNDGNVMPVHDLTVFEPEPIANDYLFTPLKTLTTTVFVEEFLEFHSVSSLPCVSTMLSSIAENDNEKNSEINKTIEEK
ncbi:unnamed protein product [Rotaria socialis]|uniref:Uncharacterized protein n=2 Tax=Rotaria socialis TaxID=392032 RepID=A0A818KPF3_9BILA|nr:unnamed protein product [Rotaria socialis]CAF3561564.1 unnamed protein product [Rotaria socialis]CAF3689104.1 unnamed protein product [Rotaria socialis]CAF4169100.1 unnamed protein product [Rotaria socialis]CAF4218545.1 unnamed protein product [Rotaria socialis]